ncbi:SDR family oxidoreductase [Amycolatopsis sp. H6(2020)]|nr:SDR family oxidoreductase [Amycolatopsis sp. H6(2020)]
MEPARIVVVTGASSGIGQATARLFADDRGYGVVACARTKDRLAELEAEHGRLLAVPADLTEDSAVPDLLAIARRRWNRSPDSFVLCAGRGLPGTVLTSDPARWQEIVELNFLAALRQLRQVAELFVGEASDRVRDIVVIGSTVGRQVSAANPIYGSTKFALHSLVEALRQEVCEHNIRVTLVEPGFVQSGFQRAAGYDTEWFAQVERDNGPLLTPDDVARVVDFVLRQPGHVHIDDVRIRPTRQRS